MRVLLQCTPWQIRSKPCCYIWQESATELSKVSSITLKWHHVNTVNSGYRPLFASNCMYDRGYHNPKLCSMRLAQSMAQLTLLCFLKAPWFTNNIVLNGSVKLQYKSPVQIFCLHQIDNWGITCRTAFVVSFSTLKIFNKRLTKKGSTSRNFPSRREW